MLTLIDLSSVYWPAYFGSKSGTSAYEYTVGLLMEQREKSDRVVVCCDHPQLLRRDWHPDYKANRAEKPADAIEALVSVEQQAKRLALPLLKENGFEADDLIATLCAQAWEEITIVGQDKDLVQLLTDEVKMLTPKHGLVGPEYCERKFGVRTDQLRDWLALAGDASDNITGCPKVGPGKATDLLQLFGDIEEIKRRAADDPAAILAVPGIGKTVLFSIQEWDPTTDISMATLMSDAPVSLEHLWDEDDAREPDDENLF